MSSIVIDHPSPAVVLLVGGTDPSGGAGLAADIKAAAAAGVLGEIVVTAVTFQSSGSVEGWEPVSTGAVSRQIEAVLRDGPPGAVKSGMLGSAAVASELAGLLRSRLPEVPYVLDPVLVAGSGGSLHEGGMPGMVRDALVPLSALCTPNLDEAEALTGLRVRDRESMERAAARIVEMGAGAALVKGGHLEGEPADFLLAGGRGRWFEGRRTCPGKLHGTGCTLASATAARLAAGAGVEEAVESSLHYLRQAAAGYFIRGAGNVPGHFPPAGPRSGRLDATAFYSLPRFCSRCGTSLVVESGVRHYPCPACGLLHYRNPLPAVTVAAVRDGRILLVERACSPGKGLHCLPGGFLELWETVEDCAARELAEETGLSARSMKLRGVETDETEYGGIMLAVMEAGGLEGTPVPGDDASDIEWFPLDSLPPLAFAAHGRIIERIRAERSGE